jgi:hypothetical protein
MRVVRDRSAWLSFHVLTFSLFYYFPYFYQSRSNDRNLGVSFPFLYHISPLVLWGAKPTAYTALGCARCLVTPSFSHLVCLCFWVEPSQSKQIAPKEKVASQNLQALAFIFSFLSLL